MSSLFEPHSTPLLIEIDPDNRRLIAAIYPRIDGIVFLDTFWAEASFHPAHIVTGEVTGDGPWTVGGKVISELGQPRLENEKRWNEWLDWEDYLQSDEGRAIATQENLESLVKPYGAIIGG